MARIALLTADTAKGKASEFLKGSPVCLNLFRIIAHAENCLTPQMRLGGALLTQQAIGDRERELLILLTARLSGCDYEWTQHVPIALNVGISAGSIDRVACLDLVADFDERDRALLAFARQTIKTARVDEDVFAMMRRCFTDREIVEALLTVGYYMTMCRVLNVTQTDLEEDPEAGLKLFRGASVSS